MYHILISSDETVSSKKNDTKIIEIGWVQIVPPKNTIGIWVSIAKEPFIKSAKSNQIMKLWLFFYNSVKTPSDLAK